LEAEPQDPDNNALSAGHFSFDTAPDEIAGRGREFMDTPKESVQGEGIMATPTTAEMHIGCRDSGGLFILIGHRCSQAHHVRP